MDNALIASTSAAIGAIALKVIERIFLRGDRAQDEATAIRRELREYADKLEARIDGLQKDLDEWKGRYWELYRVHSELAAQYKTMETRLEELMARPANG